MEKIEDTVTATNKEPTFDNNDEVSNSNYQPSSSSNVSYELFVQQQQEKASISHNKEYISKSITSKNEQQKPLISDTQQASKTEFNKHSRIIKNIVFEGGGVKGIAYAGAIAILEEKNLLDQVERVAGASVGAIAALLLGLGFDSKTLLSMMGKIDFKSFKDSKRWTPIGKTYDTLNEYGIYDGNIIKKWIEDAIKTAFSNPEATFEDLHTKILENKATPHKNNFINFREMYFIGANLSTRHYEIFSFHHTPKMKLSDAVRISMSIPLFFKPIRYGKHNDLYVDGGVLHNYPIDLFDNGRQQNIETLGFRVDPPDEIDALQRGEITHKSIDSLQSYGLALYETLTGSLNTHLRFQEEEFRTVYINTLNIGTTQFDIERQIKDQLVMQGRLATAQFIQKYMSPLAPELPIQKRQKDAERLAKTDRYKMFKRAENIHYSHNINEKSRIQLIFSAQEAEKIKKYVPRLEQQPGVEEITYAAVPLSKDKLDVLVVSITASAELSDQVKKWIHKNKAQQKVLTASLSMSQLITIYHYRQPQTNLKMMPAQRKTSSKAILEAAQSNNVSLLDKLLREGHSPLYFDKFGLNPLHYAAEAGYEAIAQLLLEFHAKSLVNLKDNNGDTATHYAAFSGQIKILKRLLEFGADINITSMYGTTPLHRAARSGHIEIVKLLVENGADISIIDSKDKTSIDHAKQYGHDKLAKYLDEYFAQQMNASRLFNI